MAIVFTKERKKQRYLILVLVLLIFAILSAVWWGWIRKEEGISPGALPAYAPPKVEINWGVLKDPQLKELQVFEEISPFEGEAGRENPFVPIF